MADKAKGGNPHYIETTQGRLNALCNLSLFPVVVCFLAFTRPTIYRFTNFLVSGGGGVNFKDVVHKAEDVHINPECKKFGWLNNALWTVTCDSRSLDIHAILAVGWLVLFSTQVICIKYNFRAFHKAVGKYGMPFAVINAFGMMQFAMYDFFYPMENTARPAVFTPFMWYLSVEMIMYLKASADALKTHDITMHAMWMYRAFVKSFATPAMRFYPLVLRYFFGTQCSALNSHKAVFAAMSVGVVFISILSYLANLYCLKEPMDKFMRTTFIKSGVTILVEVVLAYKSGSFIWGMYHCYKVGPENFSPEFAWKQEL